MAGVRSGLKQPSGHRRGPKNSMLSCIATKPSPLPYPRPRALAGWRLRMAWCLAMANWSSCNSMVNPGEGRGCPRLMTWVDRCVYLSSAVCRYYWDRLWHWLQSCQQKHQRERRECVRYKDRIRRRHPVSSLREICHCFETWNERKQCGIRIWCRHGCCCMEKMNFEVKYMQLQTPRYDVLINMTTIVFASSEMYLFGLLGQILTRSAYKKWQRLRRMQIQNSRKNCCMETDMFVERTVFVFKCWRLTRMAWCKKVRKRRKCNRQSASICTQTKDSSFKTRTRRKNGHSFL